MSKNATIALFVLAVGLAGQGPLFAIEDAWSPAETEIWQLAAYKASAKVRATASCHPGGGNLQFSI